MGEEGVVPELPSGTVTFLFTDLESSTRLWEQQPEAMQHALARHDAIVASAVTAHDGVVVKTTGDGFHAVFATAADAVLAATEAQAALDSEPWSTTEPLSVRMGIHTGEAQRRDGDYYGTAVNRAARVMAVANGGQIVCSHVTVGVAGDGFATQSLGAHRLRDLTAAEELFQVGVRQFPPLRSVDAVPTNLPVVRTELVGRTDDVVALSELVRDERLVTLTGVGGVGKTRLALATAADVTEEFVDGCWLVELAPVSADDDVVNMVTTSSRAPSTGVDGLCAYLADRRVLLVLDNCEHVLDGAASLVDGLLARAPDVHVLVTSREPLGLDGEQVRRVRSLDVPDDLPTLEDALTSSAVRLFAERAHAASDDFRVEEGNVADVVDICRRLDGIPLAIELAAARVSSMPPSEIVRRLDERFRLLGGGSRRTQERHRTLFATVSWSYDLLNDDERATFRRLSVFPVSFALAAAEHVVGPELPVVECVSRLVDRSLVVYEPASGRYRLLETLRQFGADRLADAGEIDATRARHADYFLTAAERWRPRLESSAYTEVTPEVDAELDNLRTVSEFCVEHERWDALAEMARNLWFFVTQLAPFDGVTWYRAFLAHADELDDQVVVDAYGELAFLEAYDFADYDATEASVRASLERCAHTDALESPAAWVSASMAASFRLDAVGALSASEHGLTVAEARGDENLALSALFIQPSSLALLGDHERAADVARVLLPRAKRFGHPTLVTAAMIVTAGLYAWSSPEPDFAAALAIIEREDVGTSGGAVGAMWLDLIAGYARLDLRGHIAVTDFASVARTADRLDARHVLDRALIGVAVVAAEAGRVPDACALVAFADEHLTPHRVGDFGDAWVTERLRRALGDDVDLEQAPRLRRREVIRLVDELEAALAPT
jgi:predicted ATPase/class 3 adenylate cyclase